MAKARGAWVVLLLLAAGIADADVYMWTDANGRVQYSDHPPKNFDGVVKRIDIDDKAQAPAAAPPKPAPPAQKEEPARAAPAPLDVAGKRRAERERLGEALDAARRNLAAARKALEENEEPQADERQIVLRPGAKPNSQPMPGVVPPGTRSNCRINVDNDGRKTTVCPVSMPSEAYYERIVKLEAAVKAAEEELAVAERAYRRGVD